MTEQANYINCKSCSSKVFDSFCPNCGQSKDVKRINGKYILSEIGSIFNLDKGIFYTIRELLLRPGKNIQNFILEDRKRLVKPIVYIIICSLTYTFLQQLLNFEDGYVNYSFEENTITSSIFEWVTKNYGYANILISIFIALWVKLLFRKNSYNIFEILILLCFVIGTAMLIFTVFGILDSLINYTIIDKGFFLGVLYISWGIGQFFNGNKLVNSLKGFASYMLGLMTFTILILMIGSLIDWIIK